jgi:hypothetical protein
VDGVPRAPVSNLNDLVEAHSAKEGTVEFTFPNTVTRTVLQLRSGNESVEIPIDLTETTPLPPPVHSHSQRAQSPAHKTEEMPPALTGGILMATCGPIPP